MLMTNFKDLVSKYNMNISGVIVIGAFYGIQEEQLFRELGVKNMAFFEPLDWGFNILRANLQDRYFIKQCALGSYNGEVLIHGEADNGGMSSSILEPKKHLEYYPYIHFNYQFTVPIYTLDFFNFSEEYNMLDIDVQGYELEVLKGSKETLKHIDYIYIEVNREELYEGCPMVEEIDSFLSDFDRVETVWVRQGFGDALYVKRDLL